jgi:hypothetical protein
MFMRYRVCSVNQSSSAAGIELFVAGGMAQIATRRWAQKPTGLTHIDPIVRSHLNFNPREEF